VLKVADEMKIEYASQQLQGHVGIWWCHHRNTLPENMEVVWDQFKKAFQGHYIPSGLMAIKHIEFMKLTQGDKSVTEYLYAFIYLSRYALEFINTEVKKIASFKRGMCPKLMKVMCNSKCATFNEFVSDTILQENCNVIHAASKSHEKSYESKVFSSNTLVVVTPQYYSPGVSTRYHPYQKKGQVKKSNIRQGKSNAPPRNRSCWNCKMSSHWAKDCPLPPKNPKENNKEVCKEHVQYTTVESIPSGEIITAGVFLVNQQPAIVLFDSGASHSFISSTFAAKHGMKVVTLDNSGYNISVAGNNILTNQLVLGAKIEIEERLYDLNLVVLPGLGLDVILGMKWMSENGVLIDTSTRVVILRDPKDQQAFLVQLLRDVSPQTTVNVIIARAKEIAEVPVVCEFPDIFSDDFSGLPPDRDVEFKI
jgi:hypothetical protein